MRRSRIKSIFVVLTCIVIFSALVDSSPLVLAITLLTGWCSSAVRLVGASHPSGSFLMLTGTAMILLVAGTHLFLKWLHSGLSAKGENDSLSQWRWKWTLCGIGILICGLVAICSLVLTIHQTYWISRTSDPLLVDPVRERVRTLITSAQLQSLAEASEWDTREVKKAFWQHKPDLGKETLAERVQPVFIGRDDAHLRAIILVPRRPLVRSAAKLMVLEPGKPPATRAMGELPQLLSSFGIREVNSETTGSTTLLP